MIPVLVVISGYSGTGKTTISNAVSNIINAEYISLDEIEKKITNNSIDAEKYKYPVALKYCEISLNNKKNIILDGSFRYKKTRQMVQDLASYYGATYFLIKCDCDETIAQERIKKRNKIYSGYYKNTACYSFTRNNSDPISESPHLLINTETSIFKNVENILQYIKN